MKQKAPPLETPPTPQGYEIDTLPTTPRGFAGPRHRSIGPFKIRGVLGEGGMGRVYLAEQAQPMKRLVALKVLTRSNNSTRAIEMFRHELGSLALMDHPAISKPFEAGLTSGGEPYFAMEYVDGKRLNSFCEEHALTVEQRLMLFISICRGVQHAHQKGVIHRDIKPSNILVKETPEGPLPVLIDFGIAHATSARDSLEDQLNHKSLVGTPMYMSPEQARGEVPDVRTDIYSLTMVLYHMLVGRLPFEDGTSEKSAFPILKEVMAGGLPSPSSFFATNDTQTNTLAIAELRKTTRTRLYRKLRGDLDRIISKGLATSPEDRYDTVNELMADIQAWLNHRPLSIGETTFSRLRKMVRRHRLAVFTTLLLMGSVLGGFFATSMALIRAEKAESEARLEARINEQMTDFMVNLFQHADPMVSSDNVRAIDILDQGAAHIAESLDDEPLMQARMMRVMGEAYFHLSVYDKSQKLLAQALERQERLLGVDDTDIAKTLATLGRAHMVMAEHTIAVQHLRRALSICLKHYGEGSLVTASARDNLGVLYFEMGKYNEAETMFRGALSVRSELLGPDDLLVAESFNGLGITLASRDGMEAGLNALERALAIREKHPNHTIGIAQSANNLAMVYQSLNRIADAERLYKRAHDAWLERLGPGNTRLAITLNALGDFYRQQGDYVTAEKNLLEAADIFAEHFHKPHGARAKVAQALADLYEATDRLDEAAASHADAVAQFTELFGEEHDKTLQARAKQKAFHERHKDEPVN